MTEPRPTPTEVERGALVAVANALGLDPDSAERTVCTGGNAPCFMCGAMRAEECH